MKDETLVLLFFFSAAILGPIGAIQFKRGRTKASFLSLPINTEIPSHWFYMGWPIGVGSLLTGIGFAIDSRTLAMVGLFGAFPFGLLFAIWKPRWLKPNWLVWLEDKYDANTVEFLLEQARNDKSWEQRVSTQEGLEAWAEEKTKPFRIGDQYT
jgi:hypothetical protein